MDADVQDELQAMSGAPKIPLFGSVRTLSKSLDFRLIKKKKNQQQF